MMGDLVDPNGTPNSGDEYRKGFAPIGSVANPFLGVFDGKNHSITDLYIKDLTLDGVGLFGWASSGYTGETSVGAVLKNVKILGANVSGFSRAGTLVGAFYGGYASNCHATGTVWAYQGVGGLIGDAAAGHVSYSSAGVDVSSENNPIGGLLGAGHGMLLE